MSIRAATTQEDRRPLPEIIAALHRAGVSGKLVVSTEEGCRCLLFDNGRLRAARSSVDDEQIGSWLVARGAITEDCMALSLLSQVGDNAPLLGDVLVKRGYLERNLLETKLEELAIAIVERATADRRTGIVFEDEAEQKQPDTLIRTSTREIILLSARLMGDHKAQRRFLGSLKIPARLSGSLQTILHDIEVTPNEKVLLKALSSTYYASLGDLLSTIDIAKRDFFAAAYGLVVSGMVALDQPSRTVSALREASPAQALTVDSGRLLDLNLQRAEKLVTLGNAPGAIALLEELYEQERHPSYLLKQAQILAQDGGQPQQILNTLKQVLEADPKLVEGWMELARFWRRNRNQEREHKALARALIIAPDLPEAVSRYHELGGPGGPAPTTRT
jgi:tetratricopeptide (TPR) repeat protein